MGAFRCKNEWIFTKMDYKKLTACVFFALALVACIALFGAHQHESVNFESGSDLWSSALKMGDDNDVEEDPVPPQSALSAGIDFSNTDSHEDVEDDFEEPAPASHEQSFDFASVYGSPSSASASSSDNTVHDGDNVEVHYVLRLADSGKEVYRQQGAGDGGTFEFKKGGGHVIPGFDNMISGMKVGESKSGVVIPASEGYGAKGFKAMGIPANADLEYDVEVVNKN